MLACTYVGPGEFQLLDKPSPALLHPQDAIVRVTLGSICTSDLHIKHARCPGRFPGLQWATRWWGVVERVGGEVNAVCPGDRVTVNVETFCGSCFFCQKGWVNNCTHRTGAGLWAAVSTGDRRSMSGCPAPTRGSTGFQTGLPMSRPCWWEMCWPPATGRPASRRLPQRTRC